jgi:hypothetical protein
MSNFVTSQVTISAVAASSPIAVIPPYQSVAIPLQAGKYSAGYLMPGVLAYVSSGASLTYNVEVTSDDVTVPGYVSASGLWQPFTNMSGLTASVCATLGAAVRGFRLNVTAHTSGSVTLAIVQISPD